MSRLDELIAELCPNGVEYRKLGDISVLITKGTTPKSFVKSGVTFIKTEAFNDSSINHEYSNQKAHAFRQLRAPQSGKTEHIIPDRVRYFS